MWLEQDSPWGTHGSLAALAASDPCFSAVQTGQITLRFNILMQQYSDLEAQALQAQEEQTAAAAEAEAEAAAAQSSEQAVPTTATIVPSAPQAEAAKSVALQLIQKTGHSQAAADQGQHLTGSDGQQHVAAALNSPNELMAMAFRAGHEAGALAWASQAPFLYNAGAPKAPPPPSGDGSYGPMALGAGAGAGADPAPGADARQQGSAAESAYSAGSYNPIKPPMRSAHAYPNGTYSNSGDGPAGMVNQLAALVWGGRGLARQLRRTLCSLLLEADVPFGKAVRGQYPPRTLLLTSLSHKLMQQHKQLWRGYHWPRLRVRVCL